MRSIQKEDQGLSSKVPDLLFVSQLWKAFQLTGFRKSLVEIEEKTQKNAIIKEECHFLLNQNRILLTGGLSIGFHIYL